MRSVLAGLRTLVIPWGAGPNDPQMVFGPDVPTEIALDPNLMPIVAAAIYQFEPGQYYFQALAAEEFIPSRFWTGIVNTEANVNVVCWMSRTTISGGGTDQASGSIQWGDTDNMIQVGTEAGDMNRTHPLITWTNSQRITGSLSIDSHAAPRGWKARAGSSASSAAIGAETVVLTTGSFTAVDGRAYRVSWRGRFASSVAQTATMRLRRTNAAGQLLDVWQWIYGAAQSLPFHNAIYVARALGAGNLSTTIALTLQASAGTNTNTAAATDVRYVQVDDVGAYEDYPDAIALV